MNLKSLALVSALLSAGWSAAHAQTSFGGTYSQNFNSLLTSGSANPWTNNTTLPGWSLFNAAGAAISSYAAGTGSANSGGFYSFGTTSDRALGGLGSGGAYFGSPASGEIAGYIAVGLTNTMGATLGNFTLSFTGEQWRNGGNTSAQPMVLQYGFGDSYGTVAWTTPGDGFNWSSPVSGSTAAALDGNAAANRVAGVGGTVSNLSWATGQTLWFRWTERNDVGNDHGLAIDDFSVTSTLMAIPEPSTCLAGGVAAMIAATTLVRRRKPASIAGC